MDGQNSIVKPHYRLLGMLLERQELRATLASYLTGRSASKLQDDQMIVELERQITRLDGEIRSHQREVRQQFKEEGRSLRDLRAFIGDDLIDELISVTGPARELAS